MLEAAAPQGLRTGERAAFMAEEFRLEQVLGHRGSIDRDKRFRDARAVTMQGARNKFLASTGFAGDEHGRARLREPSDGAKYLLHGRGLAKNLGHFAERLQRRLFPLALIERPADEFHRLVNVKGLGRYS